MIRVDLSDPALWQRGVPHDEFARLRTEEPVAWHPPFARGRGFWVVSRWADVVAVGRDAARFSSRHGVVDLLDHPDDELEARRTLLEEDPPRHSALRAIVAPPLLPGALHGYEQLVRRLTRARLDAIAGERRVELVAALAEPVPIRVLGRILGVADDRLGELIAWGNRLLGATPEPESATAGEHRLLPFGHPAALDAFAMADELIADRRRRPADDLLSRLVHGRAGDRPLTDGELRTMFVLLVLAGNETTRHTISHGAIALATHPDQADAWRAGEVPGAQAAEELIRWATAIHWHRRQVVGDGAVAGVELRAGDKLIVLFASANRDETVFADPATLRLGRTPNPQVAFGRGGPHFCLGAHLARLEVRVVFEELLARVERLELDGEPQRLASNHLNGIIRLPVRLRWAA